MTCRTQALQTQIASLKRRPAETGGDAAMLQRLSAMLSVCTREPPGTQRYTVEVEREQFLRRFGVLEIPKVWSADGTALILTTAAADGVALLLASLSPMLASAPMEVMVVDDGTSRDTRMLPLHVKNIRVLHAKTKAEACNLAVAAAHADHVAVLEEALDTLPSLPPEGVVCLGPSASICLERWGVTVKPMEGPEVVPAISAPRAAWLAAGGLDPTIDCGDGLAIADLALRLQRLGMRLRTCGASPGNHTQHPDPERQWNCVARFQSRWGHRPPAGECFVSQAEFDAYRTANQDQLDARYAYEQSPAEQALTTRPGTCGPCLAPTEFETLGTPPNWRDGQVCCCPDRLGHRSRAMLHLMEHATGLDPWSRILLLGSKSPLDARLARGRPAPERLSRLSYRPHGLALEARDRVFTHVVSWDLLQRVPPLDMMLREVKRVLVPSGVFVFTIPFHYRAATTISRLADIPRRDGLLPAEYGADIHDIGWDILERLRKAGFARARAHHYWSDELGYLGAVNMLFIAEA
eukprot:gene2620-2660_t